MMSLALRQAASAAPATPPHRSSGSKPLYFAMLDERGGRIDEAARSASRSFLIDALRTAARAEGGFPIDSLALPKVLHEAHRQTALAYRHYVDERNAGGPRRYFSCRSHAMHFLQAVAPTKLVDGAWLYGLLPRWQDLRLAPLIRIYLEELGCGVASQNHVSIYRHLLARYGCDRWQDGPEEHFTQGAIQLALGHHADEFLPEVIGFNLGYEQLPLHLPVTAYELNELEIDPYYFSLHVTIDNASTGHARKALQSVLDCIPRTGNAEEFYRRVANGYRLNQVGMGTQEAIDSFDLERELLRAFADKAAVGAHLHSDRCRIDGRTVSAWLSSPDELPRLLSTLQTTGWIKRGAPVEQSRFWRLLNDEQAPMFGVFDAYEQQLLRDWIAAGAGESPATRPAHRFRTRCDAGLAVKPSPLPAHGVTVRQVIAHHSGAAARLGNDAEVEDLFEQLSEVDSMREAFAALRPHLSPANHPTPAGLAATRLYADLFSR